MLRSRHCTFLAVFAGATVSEAAHSSMNRVFVKVNLAWFVFFDIKWLIEQFLTWDQKGTCSCVFEDKAVLLIADQ